VRARALTLLAAVLAATALAGVPPASASGHFNPSDVYRELRCPTCDTPLDVSNAPVAQRMKELILVRWRQGWSRERVLDALVAEFGEDVLTTPPKSGFGLVAWIVPGVGVVVGLVLLVGLTRIWVRRRRGGSDEPEAVSDADAARLDEELERFGGF
jgi:cytochrome c-type biogenesis protein CcmH